MARASDKRNRANRSNPGPNNQNNANNTPQDQARQVRQNVNEISDVIKDLASVMKEYNKTLREQGELSQESVLNVKDELALAREVDKISKQGLKGKQASLRLERLILAATEKGLDIQEAINSLKGDSLKQAKSLLENNKDVVKEAERLLKIYKDLDKQTAFFDGMADLVDSVPVLNKVFPEFRKAAQAAKEAGMGGGSVFFEGMKNLAGVGAKAIIGTSVAAMKASEAQLVAQGRALGLSKEQSQVLNQELANAFQGVQFGSAYAVESIADLNQQLGTTSMVTNMTAVDMGLLASRLGLSADQTTKLFLGATASNKEFAQLTDSAIETTLALNEANGTSLNYLDILKDISNASVETLVATGKFPGGIERAAYQARRLGLNMQDVADAASGLLNFESSIAAEMEAELMTGKQLNLERARMAALTGDQATLAQEIRNNVGSLEDFQNMTVLGRQSLATALGLSVEQISQALTTQAGRQNMVMLDPGAQSAREAKERLELNKDFSEAVSDAGTKFQDSFAQGGVFSLATSAFTKATGVFQNAAYLFAGAVGFQAVSSFGGGNFMQGGKNIISSAKGAQARLSGRIAAAGGARALGGAALTGLTGGLRLGAGGLAGYGIGKGADFLQSKMKPDSLGSAAVGVLGETAEFAAYGATLGSIIPGLGTAVGGGLGALAGAIKGLIDENKKTNNTLMQVVNKDAKIYMDSENVVNSLLTRQNKNTGIF